MIMIYLRLAALGWVLLSLSCSKTPTPPPEPAKPAPAAAAAAGEMCEHRVLKAVCTKCNPRLVPVFQAKGDWCAEHGFPESFCPTCHPERGGKPSADVSAEKAPRDGLRIRFKRADTARSAGLAWVKVSEQQITTGVLAPARLAYDATRLAQINARAPGVVRSLKVDVGASVKQGQALIVIDSPNVGADRARLAAAKARVNTAVDNLARQQRLVTEGLAAQQVLLAAEQERAAAEAEHQALAASLSILGAGGGGAGAYTLSAPIAGVVTQRDATIGRLVDEQQVLLEIVDTRSLWADIDVAEQDLPRIAAEQPVTLELDGLPGRKLEGKISFVSPAIGPHTRSAKARVPLDNPDGALRANMFGRARIAASAASARLVAPQAALQRAGDTPLLFVRISDIEFETRRVKLGASQGETVEVLAGVKAGEEVVTTGSFLLKTETSKENIGAGCCEHD
jgi:cobalt-zinc-cadmium efflux system membrane fusion protein